MAVVLTSLTLALGAEEPEFTFLGFPRYPFIGLPKRRDGQLGELLANCPGWALNLGPWICS